MSLTCRDVMVSPHVQKTVLPNASVATAFQIIKSCRSRFLPVVDEHGKYQGVFSAPTLLKLILPKAALIGMETDSSRLNMDTLGFFNLSRDDFERQIEKLKDERVADNMSLPENIPVTGPDTPVMEGIYLIHQYKRHLMLVEPSTDAFIGTVSANSILSQVLV